MDKDDAKRQHGCKWTGRIVVRLGHRGARDLIPSPAQLYSVSTKIKVSRGYSTSQLRSTSFKHALMLAGLVIDLMGENGQR
jgi:hypothetical protein